MSGTVKLSYGDQELELPLIEGADGDQAVDISSLRARTGLVTYDPGFADTGACKSAISLADGERGLLSYRGIAIEELAARSNFVETAFLLIHGHLPTRQELDAFHGQLKANATLHESFKHHFEGFPVDAPPMAMLSTMISALACFYPRLQTSTDQAFDEEAAWILSKARTIAACSYRHSQGLPFIYPDPHLGYAANLLHMMFSEPFRQHLAEPEIVAALNLVLILHADHDLGCSTTTVRAVGSSRANLFASCAAGICSLWGPVHGGATIAVVEMLEAIHKGERSVDETLALARDKSSGFRLKGFGHRIYKTTDPRAKLLKAAAERLLDGAGKHDPLYNVACQLEEKALKDPYFVDHRLYPNADFYNGIVMRAIGIPREMFTVVFAIGRMPGWVAHWKEQFHDPEARIVRPRQVYVGPTAAAYVPIEER